MLDGKDEIGIGERLVVQGEMPPLGVDLLAALDVQALLRVLHLSAGAVIDGVVRCHGAISRQPGIAEGRRISPLDHTYGLPGFIDGRHFIGVHAKEIRGSLQGGKADVGILRLPDGILCERAVGYCRDFSMPMPVMS